MTIQVASGSLHAMMKAVPSILFITDPYIEHLLEGVVDFAREHRWALNALMRRSGRFPEGVRPDGIIATIVWTQGTDTFRSAVSFRSAVLIAAGSLEPSHDKKPLQIPIEYCAPRRSLSRPTRHLQPMAERK